MSNNEAQWNKKEEQSAVERRRWLGYILAIFLAVATFFSGLYVGDRGSVFGKTVQLSSFISSNEAGAVSDADLQEFWEVWKLLDEKFVSASTTMQLSSEEKIHGAISGLVSSYNDPYTIFLPPEEAERFGQIASSKVRAARIRDATGR